MGISYSNSIRPTYGLVLVFGYLVFFSLNIGSASRTQTGTGTGGARPPSTRSSNNTKQPENSKSKKRVKTANRPAKQSKSGNNTVIENKRPKLWITYALDNAGGGNFGFLVEELKAAGVDVTFDKVALIPGRRLWEQIAERIEDPKLDGWAILLTKESLQSETCKEEMAYALDRVLHTKGSTFPLLGLIHQINRQEIPLALRTRVLIDLRSTNWPQQVVSGLKQVPLQGMPTSLYQWEVFQGYEGDSSKFAVWVRPRYGEMRHWRFIFPADASFIGTNIGHPQHGLAGMRNLPKTYETKMTTKGKEFNVKVDGAGDVTSPGTGCFIVFRKPVPSFIIFGAAKGWSADKPDEIDTTTIEFLWLNNR